MFSLLLVIVRIDLLFYFEKNRPGLMFMIARLYSWLVDHVYAGSNEGIIRDLNCNFDLYFPSTNYGCCLINTNLFAMLFVLMMFDPF